MFLKIVHLKRHITLLFIFENISTCQKAINNHKVLEETGGIQEFKEALLTVKWTFLG